MYLSRQLIRGAASSLKKRATTPSSSSSLPLSMMNHHKMLMTTTATATRAMMTKSNNVGSTTQHLQQHLLKKNSSHNTTPSSTNQSSSSFHTSSSSSQYNNNSTNNKSKSSSSSVNYSLLVSFWKQYFIRYVMLTLVIMAILYFIYWISDLFSSINFKNVAKWSFYSGLVMGVVLTGLSLFAKQYFTISSRTVYRVAMRRVLDNPTITQQLKTPIRPGKFRAYSYEYPDMKKSMIATAAQQATSGSASTSNNNNNVSSSGGGGGGEEVADGGLMMEEVPLSRRLQFWKPAHMQMMFQLIDANGKVCTVSCEVSRRTGSVWHVLNNRFKFHSLSVEMPDMEDRIILKGTEDHANQLHQSSPSF